MIEPARDEVTKPSCIVVPIEGMGQRRQYRGIVQPFVAHAHDHYVIGLIEEGHRTLVCNEQEYALSPGDMVVFNPGDVHACAQCDEKWLGYDSITLDKSLLDGAILQGPRVNDLSARAAFEETVQALDAQDRTKLERAMLNLCDILSGKDAHDTRSSAHPQAAQHVFAHFCGNLSETPAIEELALAESLSPYALIRAYRRRFSITPMQHLISLRVECACKLLAEGVEPAYVAAETGFSDQAHLTRAFKQRLGITPAAYRAMLNTTTDDTHNS